MTALVNAGRFWSDGWGMLEFGEDMMSLLGDALGCVLEHHYVEAVFSLLSWIPQVQEIVACSR